MNIDIIINNIMREIDVIERDERLDGKVVGKIEVIQD